MRQIIKVRSKIAKKIRICAVYRQGDTLIPVVKILIPANPDETTRTCRHSLVAKTGVDYLLTQGDAIYIEPNQDLTTLPQIKGLKCLALDRVQKNASFYAECSSGNATGSSSEESEDEEVVRVFI